MRKRSLNGIHLQENWSTATASNLGFCLYPLIKSRSMGKFLQRGGARLYLLSAAMGVLWGGSIFIYGAAIPKLEALETSIGWSLSLATGFLLANAIGLALSEWRHAPSQARTRMTLCVGVLLVAIVILSRTGY